jgi:DNA repair exonuclease SbcCD ATPase subunit
MHKVIWILAMAAVCGCATSGRSQSQQTIATVEKVKQEIEAAQAQLTKTVGALTALGAYPEGNLGKLYDSYAAEVSRLDACVMALRDRSTALTAKRDEYLKHWLEQTSKIQNVELKEVAANRRTELTADFFTLNGKGTAVKKAYAPLQALLQDFKRFLEADLTPAAVKSLTPELEKVGKMADEVQALVEDYKTMLGTIINKMATPAPVEKKNP